MTKSQRGNKEAKKPKQAHDAPKPLTPVLAMPGTPATAPGHHPQKKK